MSFWCCIAVYLAVVFAFGHGTLNDYAAAAAGFAPEEGSLHLLDPRMYVCVLFVRVSIGDSIVCTYVFQSVCLQ